MDDLRQDIVAALAQARGSVLDDIRQDLVAALARALAAQWSAHKQERSVTAQTANRSRPRQLSTGRPTEPIEGASTGSSAASAGLKAAATTRDEP